MDVFFVISGFLITKSLQQEMQEDRWQILKFYERRIRRLLPPFIVVSLVSTLAFVRIFPAGKFYDLMESSFAASTFASNWHFISQAGYFDASSESKPLLHTWSLSIEEQFYLVFPMALAGFRRLSSRLKIVAMALICYALFLLNWKLQTESRDSLLFFASPARFWEPLIGCALAYLNIPAAKSRLVNNLIGSFGLTGILLPTAIYDATTRFPGAGALPPVLGCAMLLVSGQDQRTVLSRALSLPPVVYIGRISYALYLWHWVILVFLHT